MTTLLITSTSSGIGARLAARHHFPPNRTSRYSIKIINDIERTKTATANQRVVHEIN
ncbi:hypothetical protein SAMN05216286_2908 [Kosakonia oryzae]|uniref:Uncharacterized protein n=1 Tax=Kosakonia oryzae TaxID=497725 RepID=A0AA94KQJ5_9ENTR|nr:hypothetical protein SAMN05216286_2908 [Kosakonia oryzae]